MYVETTTHNVYSYLRQTGEIVTGVVEDDSYAWKFNPLTPFNAMPELDMFILGITEQCNLRCTYCCYSGEYSSNRSHNTKSMSCANIDDIFKFIGGLYPKHPFRIAFYGGEPLTHYSLIQYAIEKANILWNDEVTFSITTNGTLLAKDKVDWLIAHHVKLEISIDGTASYHDKCRIDTAGNGSYSRMYQALSYITNEYPEYIPNLQLLMTLPTIDVLPSIAEEWNNDAILKHIAPTHITALAPNFAKGVIRKEYDKLIFQYLMLLDLYEQHQDWLVLKSFFNECIAYWKDRPIVDAGDSIPMSTCMPRNNKLFIDANKQIAVCEKISDHFRIGTVDEGINWTKANKDVQIYYDKRVCRCAHCPAIRMCDLCLTAIEFNEEQWDVLCHNERIYARLYMLLFCEMAERGLIT